VGQPVKFNENATSVRGEKEAKNSESGGIEKKLVGE